MKNIKSFNDFVINESSAAGNMGISYKIPFKYTSNDPRYGYTSKSFVSDLKSIFVEKPELKNEIISFLVQNIDISKIEELGDKPFSLIAKIIPEIERIIDAGEYEPELTMPGGALLFIRNKTMKDGSGADFYINKKGTKIEVVTEDSRGKEKVVIYETTKFPFERYEFTQEEREELNSLIKAKGLI